MSKSLIWSIVGIVVVAGAIIAIVLLVPGKHKTTNNVHQPAVSTSLSAAQKTEATAQIKNNLQTFFAASTPMPTRVSLLQNGQQFNQVMSAEFSQLSNEKPSVTINSITFPNKTTADVNYTILLNGQPALKNQTGEVVLVNNKWLIGDSTLCQLLSMSGTTPAICSKIH